MATDSANAAEAPTTEADAGAYVTPTADFAILLTVACLIAFAGAAMILP
ncbi:hypothetical protein [Natronomonas sp. LN261]|jgi:hypothetical protein|nr:hypothetical protein [Natronomonas sp. LN261]